MEISSIHSDMYQNAQAVSKTEKPADKNADSAKNSGSASPSMDEYVKSREEDEIVTGIYKPYLDEDGNRKIQFENPDKADAGTAEQKSCTANTDSVDREIEHLKQEQQRLKQLIQASEASGKDTEKQKKKLEAVERELLQKNNDTYRRQHTEYTGS